MSFETYRFELETHEKSAKKAGYSSFNSYLSELLKENGKVAVQLISSPLFRNFVNESKVLQLGATQFFSDTPDVVPYIDREQFNSICESFIDQSFLVSFGKKAELNGEKMKPFLFHITTNLRDLHYYKSVIKAICNENSTPLSRQDSEHIQINITINSSSNTCLSLMLKPMQLIQIIQPSNLAIRDKMEQIIGKSICDDFEDSELISIVNTTFSIIEHVVKTSQGEVKTGLPKKFKLSGTSAKRKIKPNVTNKTLIN